MGFLSPRYEAGPVFHPDDVSACAQSLHEIGHDPTGLRYVACWRWRTSRLVAAAGTRPATPDDSVARIPDALLEQTQVVVGLEGAPTALVKAVFRLGLIDDVALWLWSVPARRVPMAVRFGFRPLAPARRDARGLWLPMVCVNHDIAHLKAVHSPFAAMLRRSRLPLRSEGPQWFRTLPPVVGPLAAPGPQGGQRIEITEDASRETSTTTA